MAIFKSDFDQLKIDKLYHLLQDLSSKDQARPFEIFVDGLKVVPKTVEVADFTNYEYYVNEDSQLLRILIYNTMHSPRNDQYSFILQKNKAAAFAGLNGTGELEGIIDAKLTQQKQQFEMERLTSELQSTKEQLAEAEQYVEKLEQQLGELSSNKYKLGKLDLVELGGILLENFAAKNAGILGKFGLNGTDTGEPVTIPVATSFKKKSGAPMAASVIPDEYAHYIPFIDQLQNAFSPAELETLMDIMHKLAEDKQQIPIIAQLLNES